MTIYQQKQTIIDVPREHSTSTPPSFRRRLCRRTSRASRILIVSVVFAACIGSATVQAQPQISARTWTDSTGKQKTEAIFVKMEGDQVTLRKPGTDKTVTIPFDRLSEDDQIYVEDLLDQLDELDPGDAKDSPEPSDDDPPTGEETRGTSDDRDASPESENRARTIPNNVTNSVRGAVYRQQTTNNLRNVGLAVLNFASQKGRFPTAAIQTRDRTPLLSWRVAILPMLDEMPLYRQFRLNEPWDSEHNKQLIDKMPKVFQSPGSDLGRGFTNYLAVAGTDTVIANAKKGTRLQDIRDGTSKTLMIVEVDDTHATEWTRPVEYDWNVDDPLYGLGRIWASQFIGVFADGHVTRLDATLGSETLNGMATRAGGEFFQLK